MFKDDQDKKRTVVGGIVSWMVFITIIVFLSGAASKVASTNEDDNIIQQYEVLLNLDKLGTVNYDDVGIKHLYVLRRNGKTSDSLLFKNGVSRYLNIEFK